MFKKKPQIKNLSPLRSSDRRRLADQIIKDYDIPTPPKAPENGADSAPEQPPPDTDPTTGQTLSGLRSSLLPENTSSARFTTTSGPDSVPISGTIYAGSHNDQPERILWFQYSNDKKLYPTVYTLWHNAGLVPLLHTQGFVVEKLRGGADMMTPGLVGGPPWPEGARKGSVVAIASMDKDRVPMWVGTCEIDIHGLGDVRGSKGRAVKGLQWVGDELWSWSSAAGVAGANPPDAVDGWTGLSGIQEAVADVSLDEQDEEDEEAQADGGVTLSQVHQESASHCDDMNGGDHSEQGREVEVGPEPTTAEVDSAFVSALLYSLYNAKKQQQPPHYGFDLPIQPSYLISNMIQPHLRLPNQHYTIKKTTWKNAKKFIKHLDKQQLVKSKDRNGGETVIIDIDFNDQQLKDFVPYRLPKPKAASGGEGSTSTSSVTDASVGQTVNLTTVFRPSPRLVPDLLPSKHAFYTYTDLASYLKTYISNHPELTTGTSSPRNVKINPFLANNILGSNTSSSDNKALAAGEIPRDVLLKRIQEDTTLCPVFWVLLKADQRWSSDDPTGLPKPKPGPLPKVHITIEKRTGSKLVTKVANLETFNISPAVLAPELQKKCAGSASVGQLVGGKPGMMEVLIQGDQKDTVSTELARRGVQKGWIEVVDKSKKAKGGASGGGGGGSRR